MDIQAWTASTIPLLFNSVRARRHTGFVRIVRATDDPSLLLDLSPARRQSQQATYANSSGYQQTKKQTGPFSSTSHLGMRAGVGSSPAYGLDGSHVPAFRDFDKSRRLASAQVAQLFKRKGLSCTTRAENPLAACLLEVEGRCQMCAPNVNLCKSIAGDSKLLIIKCAASHPERMSIASMYKSGTS